MRWSPFKLERFYAHCEFSVDHVFSASDCESITVADLLELEPCAHRRFQACRLGYTESTGDPVLREAIAMIYETLGPESVIIALSAIAIDPANPVIRCVDLLGSVVVAGCLLHNGVKAARIRRCH